MKMDFVEIGLDGLDWIGLAEDRYSWKRSCESGNETSDSMKCRGTIEWLHNWWRRKQRSVPQLVLFHKWTYLNITLSSGLLSPSAL
jgi:hypothetical protein